MKRRGWIFWVAMIALTLLVITRFASLKDLGAELAAASWPWIAAAVALHFAFYVAYAYLYERAFALVRVHSRMWRLLQLVFVSYFVNSVAPAGGAAAAALFIGDSVKRGQSGARTAVGVVLVAIADIATLLPFLVYAVLYLIRRRDFTAYDAAAIASFSIFAFALVGAVVLGHNRPALLEKLLDRVRRLANWFWRKIRKRDLVGRHWTHEIATELHEASKAIAADPKGILLVTGIGILVHLINMAVVWALFPAFSQSVEPGVALVGFSLGIVFFFVAIVPQGIAVVEGMMALVFTSLGVPGHKAAAIALVFRGINYWLPLLIGALFTRRIGDALTGIADAHRAHHERGKK